MTHSPSSAQSVEIEKFLKDVATQTPEKPDYWSSCGQCERNSERAQDLLEARAAASAHPIGEDAANVAIGEREAHEWAPARIWLQREQGEGGSHTWCEDSVGDGDLIEEVEYVRAALTAEKVAGQEPYGYAPVHPNGNYFTRNKSTADYVGGLMPVYAAPQQTAQPVAQPVEHSDEWRAGYVAGCNDSESKFNFAQGVEPVIPENLHPGTAKLVRRFARALGNKLLSAQIKYGYSNNWQRDDWADECRAELMRHIAKGDPRDVAAYCAFLWHHDWPTAATQPVAQTLALTDERIGSLPVVGYLRHVPYVSGYMFDDPEPAHDKLVFKSEYAGDEALVKLGDVRALLAAQPASSLAEGDKQ